MYTSTETNRPHSFWFPTRFKAVCTTLCWPALTSTFLLLFLPSAARQDREEIDPPQQGIISEIPKCQLVTIFESDGSICVDLVVTNTTADPASNVNITTEWDSDNDPSTVEHRTTTSHAPGQPKRIRCYVLSIRVHETNVPLGTVALEDRT